MNRRLIKQGGGGYTIYLPKKWVDRKNLSAGDEISIKESSTGLILDSQVKGIKEKSITLTEESKKDINTILTHLYRRAFDKITVKNCDEETTNKIKEITSSLLLGFEVTSQEKNKITLENVSEPTGEKYDALLRRVFLIIKETNNLLLNSGKATHLEISELKTQQDKYVLFCRRTLTKEVADTDHPVLQWELLTFLTHIEHSYHYLSQYIQKNRIKLGKKETEMLSIAASYFQLLYEAYYDKNMEKIHKINKLKSDYQFGKCYEMLENSRGKEAVIASHLRETLRLVQLASSPVIGIIQHPELDK